MKKKINLNSWKRKDHFDHFNKLDDPFFGITTNIDCSYCFKKSKAANKSFFLTYLYHSLRAVNEVDGFKLRIEYDKVYQYDVVHAGPTIFREDKTFGFAFIRFYHDFNKYYEEALQEIKRVQKQKGLIYADGEDNIIHYTTIPWIKFTSVRQPALFKNKDSSPKIAFGKLFTENGRTMMPISIDVHHGLMDAWHISMYLELFRKYLDQ